jgi:hypothetical protein
VLGLLRRKQVGDRKFPQDSHESDVNTGIVDISSVSHVKAYVFPPRQVRAMVLGESNFRFRARSLLSLGYFLYSLGIIGSNNISTQHNDYIHESGIALWHRHGRAIGNLG